MFVFNGSVTVDEERARRMRVGEVGVWRGKCQLLRYTHTLNSDTHLENCRPTTQERWQQILLY